MKTTALTPMQELLLTRIQARKADIITIDDRKAEVDYPNDGRGPFRESASIGMVKKLLTMGVIVEKESGTMRFCTSGPLHVRTVYSLAEVPA